MFGFGKKPRKTTVEASGLTSLNSTADMEQQLCAKIVELDRRLTGVEAAIIELCHGLRYHLDRIDANTEALDKNMHNLASITVHPPKDLLNGGSEPN